MTREAQMTGRSPKWRAKRKWQGEARN